LKFSDLEKSKGQIKKKYGSLSGDSKGLIFDIVLFGSAVKGKEDANDLDVCVIFKRKCDFAKMLGKFEAPKMHLSSLLLEELFTAPLWLSLILEGESVLQDKKISEIFNFDSDIIFKYNLRSLAPTQKTVFSHALFGRGNGGIAQENDAQILGKGALMSPRSKSEELRKFFESWKIDYSVKECLVFR